MRLLVVMASLVFAEQVRIMQDDDRLRSRFYLTTFDGFVRLVTAKELDANPRFCEIFNIDDESRTTITQDKVGVCKDSNARAVVSCPLDGKARLNWTVVKKERNLVMLKASDGTCLTNIEVPYNSVPGLCLHGKSCDENDPKQLFEIRGDVIIN